MLFSHGFIVLVGDGMGWDGKKRGKEMEMCGWVVYKQAKVILEYT